jgi:hypothetical protein
MTSVPVIWRPYYGRTSRRRQIIGDAEEVGLKLDYVREGSTSAVAYLEAGKGANHTESSQQQSQAGRRYVAGGKYHH